MCTFAETAIVDYLLLFADQGKPKSGSVSARSKQTEVAISVFRLQQTNGGCRICSVSLCGILETWRHGHGDMETWRLRDLRHGDLDMHGTLRNGDMNMEPRKWRHRDIKL